jgi:3-dehydroquinate dehydratase-2
MKTILLLNGPNLNLLGKREPEIYGQETLADIVRLVETDAAKLGFAISSFQSNSEGEMINWLQSQYESASGLIINPAGLSHTSIVLRDAIRSLGLPAIEVHISNVYAREEFRQKSITAPVCIGLITGLGSQGYLLALQALAKRIGK